MHLLTVVVLGLSGCAESIEPADPITPVEGTWGHDTVAYSEDGCRLSGSLALGSFELSELTEDAFTYTDTDIGGVLCGLGAVTFACNTINTTDTFDDTVLTRAHTASGELLEPTAMMREVVIEGSCEGSLCGSGFGEVNFPCTTVIEAEATAR